MKPFKEKFMLWIKLKQVGEMTELRMSRAAPYHDVFRDGVLQPL
jgi:hypothetical protein